jgi:hypothetical protein
MKIQSMQSMICNTLLTATVEGPCFHHLYRTFPAIHCHNIHLQYTSLESFLFIGVTLRNHVSYRFINKYSLLHLIDASRFSTDKAKIRHWTC